MTPWRPLLLALCLLAPLGDAAASFAPSGSYTSNALGHASSSGYNAAGHLTSITHAKAGGATLAQFNYERDAKGRLTKATETINGASVTKAWEYDADGKLTKESVTAQGLTRACSYQYDAVGNRTQKDCDGQKTTYSYNSLDQLTQEKTGNQSTTYSYDGRGNLTEKKTGATTVTYTWSSDNRLQSVSDGNTKVSYGYDALGRRISRTEEAGSNKTETQWILDTARPYSEIITERTRTNGGAWSTTSYTHTPDGVGLLIVENKGGQTRHIYADAQGNTRLVTDASGNVLETIDFDAFGNENSALRKETRHRYTGESFDSATGLYHLRARDYDPNTGRFISMDEHPGSQRIPLSLNKYLYGNADPVNTIDPSGNCTLASFGISMNMSINFRVEIDSGKGAFVAKQLAELGFEMVTGWPVPTNPKNLVSSLKRVDKYLKSSWWKDKFAAGRNFEANILKTSRRLKKNTKCFLNGAVVPHGTKGCTIPDVYQEGSKFIRLAEIKTTSGALKKKQFQELIQIAQENPTAKTSIVFRKKPDMGAMKDMQRWADEVIAKNGGQPDDMILHIIYILD